MKKKALFTFAMLSLLGTVGCKQPVVDSKVACDLDLALGDNSSRSVASLNDGGDPQAEPPKPCLIPEKDPEANLDYDIALRNFDQEGEKKISEALRRMKLVINSYEFKEKVLGHTYQGANTFVDNNNLSNEEIYEKLMKGSESLLPEEDETMDLDVTLYYARGSTVGYTYEDTLRIWTNGNFFWAASYGEVAANMVHEWSHKVGFGHDYKSTARRPYSVPYAIGTIIENMIDSM